MAAIVHSLPTAVVALFPDCAELTLNPAARALLGLAEQERIRTAAELIDLARLTRSDGQPLGDPFACALAGETTRDLELRAQLQEQDERAWCVDVVPVRENGHVIGAMLTIRDVTERARDDEMGDELLGRAAHDLRTPLTALKASAQLVSRGYERLDEAARQRTLGLLLAQVEKLAARIDDVVDAARIRRGRYDLQPEELPVVATLRDAVAEIAATPGIPPCEVRGDETLRAIGDRARLRQIVARLLGDAASRGSGTRVTIDVARAANGVSLTIDVASPATPPPDRRSRTARRLASEIVQRLGGEAGEDRARRLVLTLPAAAT